MVSIPVVHLRLSPIPRCLHLQSLLWGVRLSWPLDATHPLSSIQAAQSSIQTNSLYKAKLGRIHLWRHPRHRLPDKTLPCRCRQNHISVFFPSLTDSRTGDVLPFNKSVCFTISFGLAMSTFRIFTIYNTHPQKSPLGIPRFPVDIISNSILNCLLSIFSALRIARCMSILLPSPSYVANVSMSQE